MTDDLVKRLLDIAGDTYEENETLCDAADRIEALDKRNKELETALREIAAGYETEWSTSSVTNMLDIAQILSERIVIARAALGEKKE